MNTSSTRGLPRHAMARALLFFVAYLAVIVLVGHAKEIVPVKWGQLVWGAVSTLLLVALTLLVLRSEQRRPRDVGFVIEAPSFGRLGVGIALGLALYGLTFLIVRLLAGPIGIAPAAGRSAGTYALLVATLLALSAMEEVGFRGYPLRTLAGAVGTWRAQFIVVVAFCLAHIAYGWSPPAVLFGVLPNALLFGVAAMVSQGLALPIGVHAGVNLASRSMGEHDATGLWTLVVDEATRERISTVAPWTSIALTLLCAVLLWCFYPGPRRFKREARPPQ